MAWLQANPDGFVLNTYMHVTSDYLILHRARCRTVNRPLAADRSWTYAYGKTCAASREELESWALTNGSRLAQPCGICRPGGSPKAVSSKLPAPAAPHGPRAPQLLLQPLDMTGQGIAVRIEPMPGMAPDAPPLVIEGAQWLSETFFRRDPSAVGPNSFDAYIHQSQLDPTLRDRVTHDNVTAVNTTMAARTSHSTWDGVIQGANWAWLTALDPAWDLIEMSDDAWTASDVERLLEVAFTSVQRPGLQIAVVTKVLHIKRPRLIPVLDSLVLSQIGARYSEDVRTWVAAMKHVRSIGQTNLDGLADIRTHLERNGIGDRSLVRILNSLLWTATPGAALFGHLSQWERVFRPRSADKT